MENKNINLTREEFNALSLKEKKQVIYEQACMTDKHDEILTDETYLDYFATELSPKLENTLMREIIENLKKVVAEKNLNGLSAPQIGYDRRIFVLKFNDGVIHSYINPVVTNHGKDLTLAREKCSCIPGKEFLRIRETSISIIYETPLGKIVEETFEGAAAVVVQHQMDHLNGLILSDVGLEIDENYDNATEDERAEVVKRYLDILEVQKDEIMKDEYVQKMNGAIEFMKQKELGNIKA